MKRIHLLLGVQSVLAILVSVNRLSPWTLGYVLPNEFLRWVDLNNMLLALASMVAFYLLKKTIERQPAAAERTRLLWLNVLFIIGVFLLAVSYGSHETANYLHIRFCLDDANSDLCRIVIFNDDEFSHWVFFGGFVMVNAALLFLQALFPLKAKVTRADGALLALNAAFLGAGILANLGFEEIGLDLYIVAALALLSSWRLWERGRQPLFIYYTAAYWLGLAGSLLAQAAR